MDIPSDNTKGMEVISDMVDFLLNGARDCAYFLAPKSELPATISHTPWSTD